jgi:threonine/homoserine/homoserine lactone efflux protein
MDIFFTALGIVLVVAVWPALVLYAWNDSMLRRPRRRVVRTALARLIAGASTSTPGVPAQR